MTMTNFEAIMLYYTGFAEGVGAKGKTWLRVDEVGSGTPSHISICVRSADHRSKYYTTSVEMLMDVGHENAMMVQTFGFHAGRCAGAQLEKELGAPA